MTTTEESLYGLNLFGEPARPSVDSVLRSRFVVPPFSTLDMRAGYWQDRRRAWLALGIQGELGRKEQASVRGTTYTNGVEVPVYTAVSVFDPVLCEAVYSWWSPPGGVVIDPFAGGSVRGIVAAVMGRTYWGCDLRPEQVAANDEQGRTIIAGNPGYSTPTWVCGDSMEELDEAPGADLVFTCPPYGDLERYSDDPRDLSTMEYHAFIAAMRRIMLRCWMRLRPDRFMVLVLGDFRDAKGLLRGFTSDVVRAGIEMGMGLYNSGVILTHTASLAIQASAQFDGNRMLRRAHQDVVVLCKGDPRAAVIAARGEDG